MKKYTLLLTVLFVCLPAKHLVPLNWGDVAGVLGADRETAAKIGRLGTLAESLKAADNLTPENEYYIGRAVAADIAGRYTIYQNRALQNYLNKICSTIVINSPRPDIYKGYHVAILDTNEINAFATPGGHIFVTRGLIACASGEDALASVIAHEIAHIQLRHALSSIRNSRYMDAALNYSKEELGRSAGEFAAILGDSVNEIITTMVLDGFSQSQEFDADAAALSLLASAGYQPQGILEMLQSLEQKQEGGKGFGKTHPAPAARITNVNKSIRKYKVNDTRSYRTSRFSTAFR
ncbi:peptidase M48 [Spirochaetia bacterium]|nr:peptidase M48 [Spirochaetia bacterium]